jgi:hypothetical protein
MNSMSEWFHEQDGRKKRQTGLVQLAELVRYAESILVAVKLPTSEGTSVLSSTSYCNRRGATCPPPRQLFKKEMP